MLGWSIGERFTDVHQVHRYLPVLADACVAARAADPDVLVIVGGRAVTGDEHARALGAHARAADSEEMHELLAAHVA